MDEMSRGTQSLTIGWRGRLLALIGASVLALAVSLATSAERASAATPEKTDIMFIFDTSGSMQGVLEEAKEEIKTLVANTEASLPNTEFGVANVEDVPNYFSQPLESFLTEEEYEKNTEKPWHLWQPLTSNEEEVEKAINELSGEEVAHYGGDGPEAYGRSLYETATNPQVKWRPGARHEIILIADNVPHTPNVNEGIPAEFWLENPFETGEEPAGKFGIPDTQWKEGESLEFHKTLKRLDEEEKPLAMVDYFHTGESEEFNYIHYWEYWAAATGGQAIVADEGAKSLDTTLTKIIKESAEGIPPCPPGFERTTTTPCVKKPTTPPASAAASASASSGARQRLHDREHRGKCRRDGLDHVHPDPAGHRNAGRESADGIDRQRLGHRRQSQAVQGRAGQDQTQVPAVDDPGRRGIRQWYGERAADTDGHPLQQAQGAAEEGQDDPSHRDPDLPVIARRSSHRADLPADGQGQAPAPPQALDTPDDSQRLTTGRPRAPRRLSYMRPRSGAKAPTLRARLRPRPSHRSAPVARLPPPGAYNGLMESSASETTARSWLRCYRCWSQDLEVQVHYEGIHKIDPDTGERSEVVDELQEAVVQCLDCMHDQPHLGFNNGRVEPIEDRWERMIAGTPWVASCTVTVDAEDVETCSGPEAGDALSYAAFGDHGVREFFTHVRFHKHEDDARIIVHLLVELYARSLEEATEVLEQAARGTLTITSLAEESRPPAAAGESHSHD
jgi:hypothetical protein